MKYISTNNCKLKDANLAYKKGDYKEALSLYNVISERNPELKDTLELNKKLCIEKLSKAAESRDKRKKKSKNLSYEEAFDSKFYYKSYPDIERSNVDAMQHFSNWGWREGRKPNSWFDPLFYIENYPDALSLNSDPLKHYIEIGQFENRKTKKLCLSPLPKSVKDKIPTINFDDTSENFVDYKENPSISPSVKLIAFYLPQFHPFPENDAWWGKGFTEWTNVTKAKENFKGHYQPHYPIHNGYYDLRVPDVMIEQAKLAKNYGIHGFNFYYYWFDGKVLMHKPFEILLENKEIDINFCITWANENWTRRWDGAENDILIGQNHCEEDSIKFIEHMYQYFNDGRYIRVDNKPVLIIYRANIIPHMRETIDLWRRKVKEAGFDGIYLIGAQTFGFKDPNEYGFDAAMEFPPHTIKSSIINNELEITNKEYNGNIYSYDEVVVNSCLEPEPEYKKLRSAMLSWDNTARKQNNSNIFTEFSLLRYKQWLSHIVNQSYNNPKYSKDEKFIFVNAWNEWAEGTHLEPDRKHGYAYLQTSYDVLKNYDKKHEIYISNQKKQKNNSYAIIIHIHYNELWDFISEKLTKLNNFQFDLYITITSTNNEIIEKIKDAFPQANITIVENRGRDIRPFINLYKEIKDFRYKAICKIHSKKSEYRADGNDIRNELFDSLIGSEETISKILNTLKNDQRCGLITTGKYLIPHTDKNMTYDGQLVHELSEILNIEFKYSKFPAGSMYWFKPEALSGIEKIEDSLFEPEEGLADGTLAHAVERIIINIVNSNGFSYGKLL